MWLWVKSCHWLINYMKAATVYCKIYRIIWPHRIHHRALRQLWWQAGQLKWSYSDAMIAWTWICTRQLQQSHILIRYRQSTATRTSTNLSKSPINLQNYLQQKETSHYCSFSTDWAGVYSTYHVSTTKQLKKGTNRHDHRFMAIIQYRSTCVSRHLQLRTGGFCWCKVLPPACPCWWQPAHSD